MSTESSTSTMTKYTSISTSCQYTMFIVLMVLSILITMTNCAPISTIHHAELYLSKFGYLPASARNPASGNSIDPNTWTKAVKDFQNFGGLNVTGEIDEETMQLMSLPRCGVRDKVGSGSDGRPQNYLLYGSRWPVKNLTYRISKYPKRLRAYDVDAEVARAFAVWSQYTDLSFTRKSRGAIHIEIKFVEGEHGDGDSFDGVDKVLAHSSSPTYGGDVHFDDAELWTIGSKRGKNLLQVAAHEFGHSLGLKHSDVPSALMGPFYKGFKPSLKLHKDDIILGIQALYGKKTSNPTPGATYPHTTKRPATPKSPTDDDKKNALEKFYYKLIYLFVVVIIYFIYKLVNLANK